MEKNILSRNWTPEETLLYCEILTDPINNFMVTLEKKALKKSSTKEVFEEIAKEFEEELQKEVFKNRNAKYLKGKKKEADLKIDIKKLQYKYNNIKQQWRKISDKKKNGSGLKPSNDPEWYKIVNPVLTDSNQGIDSVCSKPEDTSFE